MVQTGYATREFFGVRGFAYAGRACDDDVGLGAEHGDDGGDGSGFLCGENRAIMRAEGAEGVSFWKCAWDC